MEYITHFNVRLKKTSSNCITRDNYCIPTKKIDYKEKKNIKLAKQILANVNNDISKVPIFIPREYIDIPNAMYADEETYTDEYLQKQYENCMINYDLNMAFFDKLDYEEFCKCVRKITKSNKFKQITDLNTLSGVQGLYILVLDQYKQVYVGKSIDIKSRILNHWSRKKHFGFLLCGSVETSVLSVDSFGALDTTRVFYKECGFKQIDEMENKVLEQFDNKFVLNRVAGGINGLNCGSNVRNLLLSSTINKRILTEK